MKRLMMFSACLVLVGAYTTLTTTAEADDLSTTEVLQVHASAENGNSTTTTSEKSPSCCHRNHRSCPRKCPHRMGQRNGVNVGDSCMQCLRTLFDSFQSSGDTLRFLRMLAEYGRQVLPAH
ncbi:unnamed protein product [Dicrocoelium dendriticum]|nr:unnamed protein product [Dicrocoelium dendriticum]CAH8493590.1 unnamed protein product [Dicrocoelium dendriticum]CAI2737783.1 unnamed protein product [Dicrocoelium dendriticum]